MLLKFFILPLQPLMWFQISLWKQSHIYNWLLSLSLILRPTVSWPVYLGIKHPSEAYDQIFVTIRQLRDCWCRTLSLTRGRICHLQLLLALASTRDFCLLIYDWITYIVSRRTYRKENTSVAQQWIYSNHIENTVFCCQECVFIGPLPSNGSTCHSTLNWPRPHPSTSHPIHYWLSTNHAPLYGMGYWVSLKKYKQTNQQTNKQKCP
jgi:hypothetical protein